MERFQSMVWGLGLERKGGGTRRRSGETSTQARERGRAGRHGHGWRRRSGLAGQGYPPGWRNPHPPRLVDLTLRIYQWRKALFQTRTSARLGSYHPPVARVASRAPASVINCPFLCGDCNCPLLLPLCPAAFSLLPVPALR